MFEGLTPEDVDNLGRTVSERTFAAGEHIFRQGDVGTEMFVVVSGHINIHLAGEASRRISLKDLARGEYFGELALFDDKPRSASALATTDARLLVLGRDTLSSYLEQRPRAAMSILRTMSERLRQTNAMLSSRAAKNVVEELEKNLSWSDRLADRVAELNGSWAFIILLLALSVVWAVVNTPRLVLSSSPDPFPYVFYNLLLALLVALQGPLIVMSQNRQASKDRATAESDFKVNLKNEVNIETLLRELGELRVEVNLRLGRIEGALALREPSGNYPLESTRAARREITSAPVPVARVEPPEP